MLFAHNTKVKSRSSSKNRAAKKEQAEVSDGNKVLLSVRSFFAKQKIAPAGAPQAVF